MGVAVAAQRGPQAGLRGRPGRRGGRAIGRGLGQQRGQVAGLLPGHRLGDDLGRGSADAGQRAQRAVPHPPRQLGRGQLADHLRGPAEGPHPVGRCPGPLELERDLTQRLYRIHLLTNTRAGPSRATGRPAPGPGHRKPAPARPPKGQGV
jgi:hypothetical protein